MSEKEENEGDYESPYHKRLTDEDLKPKRKYPHKSQCKDYKWCYPDCEGCDQFTPEHPCKPDDHKWIGTEPEQYCEVCGVSKDMMLNECFRCEEITETRNGKYPDPEQYCEHCYGDLYVSWNDAFKKGKGGNPVDKKEEKEGGSKAPEDIKKPL